MNESEDVTVPDESGAVQRTNGLKITGIGISWSSCSRNSEVVCDLDADQSPDRAQTRRK
jgi:hypothetical protein